MKYPLLIAALSFTLVNAGCTQIITTSDPTWAWPKENLDGTD